MGIVTVYANNTDIISNEQCTAKTEMCEINKEKSTKNADQKGICSKTLDFFKAHKSTIVNTIAVLGASVYLWDRYADCFIHKNYFPDKYVFELDTKRLMKQIKWQFSSLSFDYVALSLLMGIK